VVDVDGGESDAKGIVLRCVCSVKREKEGYGVCSAGDGDTKAVAGADVFAGEEEDGGGGHAGIIVTLLG
jgi:hypothetical protein